MQARIDQIRKEARQLIPLLTFQECRQLLGEDYLPFSYRGGKSFQAVKKALSDENKVRADIFRKELHRNLTKEWCIMRAKGLLSDDPESKQERDTIFSNADKDDATEAEKMLASILRAEMQPPSAMYGDALDFITDYLAPSETALRALDRLKALEPAAPGGAAFLSERELRLLLEAKSALRDQGHFAQCSRSLHQIMQYKIQQTLPRHIKKGNLSLVDNILLTLHEHEELLFKLLTQTFKVPGYPDSEFTLMQLACVEKNGRMGQVLKEAFKQLPNGLALMQMQLNDPLVQSRLQQEILYDFSSLITAIITDTNVEAELAQYRENLAIIIAEGGFPLTIFSQIIDIFYLNRGWTDFQRDILLVQVFGHAQRMSPDWVKIIFGCDFVDPFQFPFVAGLSLGVSYFVFSGRPIEFGCVDWDPDNDNLRTYIETLGLNTNVQALAELRSEQPLPRASREPS